MIASLLILAAVVGIASPTPSPHLGAIPEKIQNHSAPNSETSETAPSPSGLAEQSPANREEKKQNPDASEGPFLRWTEKYEVVINGFSALVMAVFSVVLTIYTVRLWKSGEKHSERELRAYLYVVDVKIRPLSPGGAIEAFVRIRNGGQTPAYNASNRSSIWIDKFPSNFRPVDKKTESTLCVGPNSETGLLIGIPERLTEEQYSGVDNGKLAVYVAGEIQYTDAFGKQRATNHRGFFFNTPDNLTSLDGQMQVSPSEEGNEAT